MANHNETITAPKGFRAAGVACGIKPNGVIDLALLVADVPCAAAAVFTKNRFPGAPIVVGREHVRGGRLQAVVVNSGNSNVATGQRGVRDARQMCLATSVAADIEPTHVLPSSTGVIGRPLPIDKVQQGIAAAAKKLANTAAAGHAFARAIMTTDTKPKQACVRLKLGKATVTVAGAAKGSGMIAPNMATMLAYLTTDAAVNPAVLRPLLRVIVERTFNRISVDECPSTSDTVAILASGRAGNPVIRSVGTSHAGKLGAAIEDVAGSLAYDIVADGEGATRVIDVQVRGARSAKDAHAVARAIAASPLVKTAVHGGDPNWGRIVQAIGACQAAYNPTRVRVRIGDMAVFGNAQPIARTSLRALQRAMKAKMVVIRVDLGAGSYDDHVLTCDLSREYVAINADYTT